eukprot:1883585-Pleurochrysis_carterae.AAC.1
MRGVSASFSQFPSSLRLVEGRRARARTFSPWRPEPAAACLRAALADAPLPKSKYRGMHAKGSRRTWM